MMLSPAVTRGLTMLRRYRNGRDFAIDYADEDTHTVAVDLVADVLLALAYTDPTPDVEHVMQSALMHYDAEVSRQR